MSVQHITLFELTSTDESVNLDSVLDDVSKILKTIPGVEKESAGRNFTDRSPGISHAAIVTLESHQALSDYMTNPNHIEAQKLISPYIKNGMAVDCEVTSLAGNSEP